jgi:hypothetical protein
MHKTYSKYLSVIHLYISKLLAWGAGAVPGAFKTSEEDGIATTHYISLCFARKLRRSSQFLFPSISYSCLS